VGKVSFLRWIGMCDS